MCLKWDKGGRFPDLYKRFRSLEYFPKKRQPMKQFFGKTLFISGGRKDKNFQGEYCRAFSLNQGDITRTNLGEIEFKTGLRL